jgi:hypothetical protein
MSVVEKAEFHGEGSDGVFGFGEFAAGGFDADFEEVLPRGGAEDGAEAAVELAL